MPRSQKSRASLANDDRHERPSSQKDVSMFSPAGSSSDKIYGLIPVIEALRAGQRTIENITIAEGARHERLRELLLLAKQAKVPIHRVPRITLDKVLKEKHQGVVARTAAVRYRDADDLLELLGARVGTCAPLFWAWTVLRIRAISERFCERRNAPASMEYSFRSVARSV